MIATAFYIVGVGFFVVLILIAIASIFAAIGKGIDAITHSAPKKESDGTWTTDEEKRKWAESKAWTAKYFADLKAKNEANKTDLRR